MAAALTAALTAALAVALAVSLSVLLASAFIVALAVALSATLAAVLTATLAYTYKPCELFDHFIKVVLPLANENGVTDGPPVELPGLPTLYRLGTRAQDCIYLESELKHAIGTMSAQRAKLDTKTMDNKDEFDEKARKNWKERESEGIGSVYSTRQKRDAPTVDETLIGKRIEYLSEFDIDTEGTTKELRWCSGVVERICDGTWVIPGRARKCWNEGEAVEVFFDAIPDADMVACREKVALNTRKWNKDCDGAWRMDLGEYNFGV